jgi:hypothetical protein
MTAMRMIFSFSHPVRPEIFRRSGFSPEAMPVYHAPASFSNAKKGWRDQPYAHR